MVKFIPFITICAVFISAVLTGCSKSEIVPARFDSKPIPIAEKFGYPIGESGYSTQSKDSKDEWYNALDFGDDDHLGEDWNKNSGGNTDCGETVYAAANGIVAYAADAGPGWGNVVIIDHQLTDGRTVQSLYGHLSEIADVHVKEEVEFRQSIGLIGNAHGRYPCHLHFEIRLDSSLSWNQPGPGYSREHAGWVDPSDFIDSLR